VLFSNGLLTVLALSTPVVAALKGNRFSFFLGGLIYYVFSFVIAYSGKTNTSRRIIASLLLSLSVQSTSHARVTALVNAISIYVAEA